MHAYNIIIFFYFFASVAWGMDLEEDREKLRTVSYPVNAHYTHSGSSIPFAEFQSDFGPVFHTESFNPKENPTQTYLGLTSAPNGEQVDGRKCISDTSSFPYCTHGYIDIEWKGQKAHGSGTLIGPRHVLTAGHCLYDRKDGWATSVEFFPGKNGKQSGRSAKAVILLSVAEWVEKGSTNFDFGMIVLNDDLGDDIGWMGMFSPPLDFLNTLKPLIHVTGYPDFLEDRVKNEPPQMYSMPGSLKQSEDCKLLYSIDTSGGQSGGGVWVRFPGLSGYYLIGTHSNGSAEDFRNLATRITDQKFKLLLRWIAESSAGESKWFGGLRDVLKKRTPSLVDFLTLVKGAQSTADNQIAISKLYYNHCIMDITNFPLHQEKAMKWYKKAADNGHLDQIYVKHLFEILQQPYTDRLPSNAADSPFLLCKKANINCKIGDLYRYKYIFNIVSHHKPEDKRTIPEEYKAALLEYQKDLNILPVTHSSESYNALIQKIRGKIIKKMAHLFCAIGDLYYEGYGCENFWGYPYTMDKWAWNYDEALLWYEKAALLSSMGVELTKKSQYNITKIKRTGHLIKREYDMLWEK